MDVVKKSQESYPSYAANFPTWADNSQGILQATVWTAFALEGLGASLQHYQPLIDEGVRKEWNLPETWSKSLFLPSGLRRIGLTQCPLIELSAQAPFGVPAEGWEAPDKSFAPIDERVKIFE